MAKLAIAETIPEVGSPWHGSRVDSMSETISATGASWHGSWVTGSLSPGWGTLMVVQQHPPSEVGLTVHPEHSMSPPAFAFWCMQGSLKVTDFLMRSLGVLLALPFRIEADSSLDTATLDSSV